jgi:polyhydroxybutyrate depolymerase
MTERAAFLFASVLALSASACGSSSDGDPDGGGGGGGGCGEAASIALGSWVEQSVSVPGGGSRVYFVRLPAGYDPDERYPVVYQLHGCSDSATPENNNVPVENQSGDEAIHVRGRAADNCWDTTTDLPYFDAVVDDVEDSYCADPDRRLLTGYSSGAFFAHRIACVRGDTIRGIATIAGGSPGGGCVGEVAVLQIHDANDQTVMIAPVGYPTRDHWITANGCDATSTPTDDPPCVAYDGCNAGAPVVWCETTGQDHARQDGLAGPIFWEFLSSL